MGKLFTKRYRRWTVFLIAVSFIIIGFLIGVLFLTHTIQPWWIKLTTESKRILGWEKREIPPEEKRIREEVILKKMEEASAQQDWRDFAPEYPRLKKKGPIGQNGGKKVLRESPEFKEMEKELRDFLSQKEGQFKLDPPIPSLRDEVDLTRLKDKGAEKIIVRLLGKKGEGTPKKPLEENLKLGMKGPLVFREILEKPPLPQVKVRAEVEIELTIWVLPDGKVARIIPSVKGDMELERVAIQYLKQWRFISLPKDQPQIEQWGTIPIKFKLQ